MTETKFHRIAFGDWDRAALGIIYESTNNLEIMTSNQVVRLFLQRCLHRQEVISNPVVWEEDNYRLFTGAYKVIYLDEESVVLRLLKKRKR